MTNLCQESVYWSNTGLSLMIVQDRKMRASGLAFFSVQWTTSLTCSQRPHYIGDVELLSLVDIWGAANRRRVCKDVIMLSLVLYGSLQTLWKHSFFFPEFLTSNNHKRVHDITKLSGTKVLEGTISDEYHMSTSVFGQKLMMQSQEIKPCDKATFVVEHPGLLIERS